MRAKKLAAIGLSLALALPVFSGATAVYADDPGIYDVNKDAPNTEVTDETLTIALQAEPSTLWGAGVGKLENEDCYINSALFDTLVILDQEAWEVKPNLATSWEWIDETHCRFTLRDDVVMTDGTPLVADDVVYSVNTWMTQSAATDTGRFIAGAEAEDEHTVVIAYTVAAPDLLIMMGWAQFGIVSEDEVNALGGYEAAAKNPVMGSGRYRFSEWINGKKIVLTRNEDYWNPDYKGYFKEIVLRFIGDSAGRVLNVSSGDVDVACDVPLVEATAAESADKVYIYTTGQMAHLWYNMSDNAGATKELKVRQAIDKALNFDAIATVATGGLFTEPQLGYAGTASPYYTPLWTEEERAVDIDGAKALLEEAGYGDGLELRILGLANQMDVLTIVQGCLSQIGIKVTIDTPDVATFVGQAFGGDYDLTIVGELLKAKLPTSMPFLVRANIEGPGVVIGGPKWTTDEIDSEIAEFITEADSDKATEILANINQQLKDQQVCSDLYLEPKAHVAGTGIKGLFTRDERGYLDLTQFYR